MTEREIVENWRKWDLGGGRDKKATVPTGSSQELCDPESRPEPTESRVYGRIWQMLGAACMMP